MFFAATSVRYQFPSLAPKRRQGEGKSICMISKIFLLTTIFFIQLLQSNMTNVACQSLSSRMINANNGWKMTSSSTETSQPPMIPIILTSIYDSSENICKPQVPTRMRRMITSSRIATGWGNTEASKPERREEACEARKHPSEHHHPPGRWKLCSSSWWWQQLSAT